MKYFKRKKFSTKIIIVLILLICSQYIFAGLQIGKELTGILVSYATSGEEEKEKTDPNEGQYIRLTDTEKLPIKKSNVGYYDSVKINEDYNGNKLSVMMEGAYYPFDYGLFAHANANIYYDISEYSEKYHYLTTYIGINQTAGGGNGVKVWIYTSDNDTFYESGSQYWTLQNEETDLNRIIMPKQNAIFEKVDITGAKYLRIQIYDNGSNASDHAVFINPMLITDEYKEEENSFLDISVYDKRIKEYANKDLADPNYELLVLQREFLNRIGNYGLKRFTEESPENQETINWLMNDVTNLRYYILGGTPTGGYYNSLNVLTRLLKEYKSDFDETEEISETGKEILMKRYPNQLPTKGELYKRMAITISLTHSAKVALWMQPSAKENQSDAIERYAIYKKMYNEGKFKATDNANITPWFETYNIEEMRYVMNTAIDDESILWLNEYTQQKIDATPNNVWGLLTPHSYLAYVWPNYANPVYYAEENVEYFNELFAVGDKGLFDYDITRGTSDYKLYKLWMNFRNKFGTGAVCGGISKTGHCIRGVHAIPSAVIGQPGHAAIIYYTRNSNGQGYWGIDNDVSGWTKSEKGERLLIGWGNDTSYVKGYNVPYIALAQEALNDYQNFVKAEELLMTVDVYQEDKAKQEQIYREAIKVQSINLDAWAGLVKLYLSSDKTEEEYYNLAKEMMEALKCFPFTMYNLSEIMKPKFTTDAYKFKFTILQTRILTEGKNYQGTEVLQPSLTRLLASSLLGTLDTKLADFSFDGVDAEKIKLGSKFDGNTVRWDYSLDGKNTWNEVFTGENGGKHEVKLSKEQVASITSENDIYVHIIGVNYNEENLYKIDIQESEGLPSTLYDNDNENRMIAVNLSTQWRYTENDSWTSYSEASPDLTGNKTVQLRQGATGTRLASNATSSYTFTENSDPDTRKYIPVSHLSIHAVSTEAVNNAGAAKNAIDANYNTRYHSAWNGTDTERYIAVKLDKPMYISAVEFVPAGGGNGRINDGTIWGSMDGENWEILTSRTGITYPAQANTNETAKQYTQSFDITEPKQVQYVKIVADRTNGNWFSARAFNFYEDITRNPEPTASIGYSTTEKTNEPVVARLVNPSTKITITNNDGKDTYVFTKNGEFTFEFEDERGNKGTVTARVDWIDKDAPTADVSYKLGDDKKLIAILDNISEDVYLLDKNNKKTNYVEVEDGRVVSISYLDDEGNVYKIAELDENAVTKKITYTNTTGKLENVKYYITSLENGEITDRLAFDNEGNSITLTGEELEELKKLENIRSNPLEFYLEKNEEYEFRLLDVANNIAYKNIKVDYIDNDTKILASDITYSTTMLTNQDVIATIKANIIDENGKKGSAKILNNDGNDAYTFEKNGEFTFEYMDSEEEEENPSKEVKSHTAKVDWIDKIVPTAQIRYSTRENAEKIVVTLVNESEEITITNNGSSREYTFTENGEFTFEFQDRAGNEGKATAKVDWMKKEEPAPTRMKGDTDGDGEITANDVAQIKLHLIQIRSLEGIDKTVADLDDDGEVTTNDLALVMLIMLGLR